MLSSMAVVRSAFHFLRTRELDDAARRDFETVIDEQMTLIVEALTDLARGLPAEALALLRPPKIVAELDLDRETSDGILLR